MTIKDTKKIIAVITATYPGYYRTFSQEMLDNLVRAWFALFKEYDYEDANTGLQRFMKSDNTGFPPSPGQVIAKIPSKYEKFLEEAIKIDQHNLRRRPG